LRRAPAKSRPAPRARRKPCILVYGTAR
jgi:hypothetical protein